MNEQVSDTGPRAGTTHLHEVGEPKTLCGRGIRPRVHHSWPMCKSCLRIAKPVGWAVVYDHDGWSVNQPSASASYTKVLWISVAA